MLKLYFIAHDYDTSDSMDWFVIAHDRNEAIMLWRRDNSIDPDITDGPDNVFEVPAVVPASEPNARILEWHVDVKEA